MAAVTIDFVSNSNVTNLVASKTFAHTCSGANRALYVAVHWNQPGTNVTEDVQSVTYNGGAMTAVSTPSYSSTTVGINRVTQLYRLIAPVTGTNNIVVTMTNPVTFFADGISFNNVDQSFPDGGYNTAFGTSGTSAVLNTSTNSTDDIVLSAIFARTATTPITQTGTQRWSQFIASNNSCGGATQAGTGGTVTSTWSWSGASHYGALALRINPVPVPKTVTQSASARIAVLRTKTQSAVARIAVTLTKAQQSAARIAVARSSTQNAVARISVTRSSTQGAASRISVRRTAAQSAGARVAVIRSLAQTVAARVSATLSSTMPAKARIAVSQMKVQSAAARIARLFTRSQQLSARISVRRTSTRPATARIVYIAAIPAQIDTAVSERHQVLVGVEPATLIVTTLTDVTPKLAVSVDQTPLWSTAVSEPVTLIVGVSEQ